MGKKSRRQRPSKNSSELTRREVIAASVGTTTETTPREQADRAREAFINVSKDRNNRLSPERSAVFQQYDAALMKLILLDHAVPPSDMLRCEDSKCLKSVWRDTSERVYIRVLALKIWAAICAADLDIEDCVHAARLAINIIDQADEAEMRRDGQHIRAIQENLDRMLKDMRESLQASEEWIVGEQCDVCLAEIDLSAGEAMRCCGICQLTFYCSKKCQKADWNDGHKDVCRKKGEFKAGDVATVPATVELVTGGREIRPTVTLLDPAPAQLKTQTESWLVATQTTDGVQLAVVPTTHLRRTRPAEWDALRCIPVGATCEWEFRTVD
jgi:MYND finger